MPHNIPLIGMVGNLYVHFHQSRMSQHTIADAQAAQCLKIDPCEKGPFQTKRCDLSEPSELARQ